MKKIFSFVLILTLTLSLFSCGEIEYDENEVKAQSAELIKKSAVLNEIYWGKGIDYVYNLNFSDGSYFMADDLSLYKYGIKTISDLEVLTRATFSEKYSNSTLMSSLEMRYYQKYDDLEGKEPSFIMVNSDYQYFLTDSVEYLYDTVKVLSSDKKHIYITVDAIVTRGEKSQTKTLEVSLVVENGNYRIDTPTYTTYTETE